MSNTNMDDKDDHHATVVITGKEDEYTLQQVSKYLDCFIKYFLPTEIYLNFWISFVNEIYFQLKFPWKH